MNQIPYADFLIDKHFITIIKYVLQTIAMYMRYAILLASTNLFKEIKHEIAYLLRLKQFCESSRLAEVA